MDLRRELEQLRQQVKLLLNQKNAPTLPPRNYALFSLLRFGIQSSYEKTLDAGKVSEDLQLTFKEQDIILSNKVKVTVKKAGKVWLIDDMENEQCYSVRKNEDCLMVYFDLFAGFYVDY